jgi:D-threonate/D-erythronate kinase
VGAILPGVPRSIMRGGRWDGVTIVSKSGAFGGPDLFQQLVAASAATTAGAAA